MTALEPGPRRSLAPWIAAGVIGLITVLALRLEGRIWWCECGQARVWISDVHSAHCSQHLLDPYALTHVLHGVGFYGLLVLIFPRVDWRWRMVVVLGLEAGWEVLENSPWVIERYRTHTAALGYQGDSVVNALGDVGACLSGGWFARRMGWKWSLGLWIAVEALLVLWIRDNLFLNVWMLLVPSEGLKAWQGG